MGEDLQRYENVFPREGWPEGPWDHEPLDKAVWIDDETGFDCMIVRGPLGTWCGYVGLPKGHPYYEMNAYDIPHGDFNYGAKCDDKGPESESICHVPAPGRDGDVWWVGFDLGHAFDVVPSYLAEEWSPFRRRWDAQTPENKAAGILEDSGYWKVTYKNEAFVRAMVSETAKRFAAAAAAA